jgi:Tfp pilus assembly protein PilF
VLKAASPEAGALVDRKDQLRKFIAASPDEPFPRYALALELKGSGDAAAAAAEMKELLQRAPDYLAAYLMYGMLLQTLGRQDEARAAFHKGQEVARRKADSHTLSELTQALESMG